MNVKVFRSYLLFCMTRVCPDTTNQCNIVVATHMTIYNVECACHMPYDSNSFKMLFTLGYIHFI